MNWDKTIRCFKESGEPLETFVAATVLKVSAVEEELPETDLAGFVGKVDELPWHSSVVPEFVTRSLGNHADLPWIDSLLPEDAEALSELLEELCGDTEIAVAREVTPPSIANLALKMLDIGAGGYLVDFNCGMGMSLYKQVKRSPDSCVAGLSLDPDTAALAMVRGNLLNPLILFDCWKLRQPEILAPEGKNVFLAITPELCKLDAEAQFAKVSPWKYCRSIAESLDQGCRAAVVVPRSSTNIQAETAARKELAETGKIEAVVQLPERAMKSITAPVLVLISASKQEAVRMVDASALGRKDRTWGVTALSEEEVEQVAELLQSEGSEPGLAASVTCEQIGSSEFCLEPARYVTPEAELRSGEPLRMLAEVRRGATKLSKEALGKPDTPSGFRLLLAKNIEDGRIDYGSLPYLDPACESEYREYCLKPDDIVVSKVGPNYKVAIVEAACEEAIVASSNLYVIRANRLVSRPYYLRAFFESGLCWQQLRNAAAGSGRLQSIPVGALRELKVPLASLDDQDVVAETFRDSQERTKLLQDMLADERTLVHSLFDIGVEECRDFLAERREIMMMKDENCFDRMMATFLPWAK